MAQGKDLTEIEVHIVCFLRRTGVSIHRIANEIRRSKIAVENVIIRGADGWVEKRFGLDIEAFLKKSKE